MWTAVLQLWLNKYCLSPYYGEGNGTPLQYSCLENPMDGGAWWAAVHGVARSRTWQSNFTFTFHFHALEKEMATHSRVLAWRTPGTGEPSGLPSMGSHRAGHDWSDSSSGREPLLCLRPWECTFITSFGLPNNSLTIGNIAAIDWMCPATFIYWNLTPTVMVLEGGAFGRYLGYRVEPSWTELVPLWKRLQESSLIPSFMWGHSEKRASGSVNQKVGSYQTPNQVSSLTLEFSASKTLRNEFLWLINHLAYDILLE